MGKEENRVIKFWKGDSGRYYWMLFSGNGDSLCECMRGYTTLTNAKRAARDLFPTAQMEKDISDWAL